MSYTHTITGDEARQRQGTPEAMPDGVQGGVGGSGFLGGRPDYEHNRRLRAGQDIEEFRKLERSGSVGPHEAFITGQLTAGKVVLEQDRDTDPRCEEYVSLLLGIGGQRHTEMRPFKEMVRQALAALFWGRAFLREEFRLDASNDNVIFDLHDTDLESVAAYWVDERERLVAIEQFPLCRVDESGGEDWTSPMLDVNRTLVLTWRQRGLNFDGIGLYRNVEPYARDIVKLMNIDVIGHEAQAWPRPIIKPDEERLKATRLDPKLVPERLKKARELLADFFKHKEQVGSIEPWMDIKAWPPEGHTYDSAAVLASIAHREHRIALAFMSAILLHGDQHSGGNRSLGETNEDLVANFCASVMGWLAEHINDQLLARAQWFQFRGSVPPERYARIKFTGFKPAKFIRYFSLLLQAIEQGVVTPGPALAKAFLAETEAPDEGLEDDRGPEQRVGGGGVANPISRAGALVNRGAGPGSAAVAARPPASPPPEDDEDDEEGGDQ